MQVTQSLLIAFKCALHISINQEALRSGRSQTFKRLQSSGHLIGENDRSRAEPRTTENRSASKFLSLGYDQNDEYRGDDGELLACHILI
jgi:hypothetical protein